MAASGKAERPLSETLLDFKLKRISDWGLWVLEWVLQEETLDEELLKYKFTKEIWKGLVPSRVELFAWFVLVWCAWISAFGQTLIVPVGQQKLATVWSNHFHVLRSGVVNNATHIIDDYAGDDIGVILPGKRRVLAIDEWLRVKGCEDVYVVGDCGTIDQRKIMVSFQS
ncbi:External alternative NAD(P)H-ubiquinone oxidoreductase B1 [Arachis hypogaea]|nr:External alternative NAD(P)H-ubiquinone oxidoreductase B1 [Arachis hypogaea]